jgi:acyl-lipid omega-6 desaturase (Delta-12 desaturase)
MPDDTALMKEKRKAEMAAWKAIIAEYQQPHLGRACWQLINTLGLYILVWVLMYLALRISWWLTVPLIVLGGGLSVRAFIIFHDCGHHSFFKSRLANDFVGYICGLLTFTPYYHWRWEHALHHSTSGNLDRRGIGDVWTLTVQEYLAANRWTRFAYRLLRNPFVLFVIAPIYLFLLHQRIPKPQASLRERLSVYWMNCSLLIMASGMIYIFGIWPYLIIQLAMISIAGSAGIWLFYVQHQFEDAYWERADEWDYTAAAIQGSSFYKLPSVLQWFSGNIGFHHIHHLSPRIPNYNLERCHLSHPAFRDVKPVTLFGSLKSLSYRLWDESNKKLIGYRQLRQIRRDLKRQGKPSPPDRQDPPSPPAA